MYIILFLLIVIFSSILSFASSGVEHIFKPSNFFPLGYYFIAYSIILYVLYRIRFKRISIFKFFLLRNFSKLNSLFNKIEKKVYDERVEVDPMQQKSIRAWSVFLKDTTTSINSNILTQDRIIQKGELLIILKNKSDSNLTIMDTRNNRNLFYQVFIPQKYAMEMASVFDKEHYRRMKILEQDKRSDLESVINLII